MTKTGVSTEWIRDLDNGEQDKFTEILYNNFNDPVLVKLKKIVVEKRKSLEASERNPNNYKDPNWAYMQAHNNGTCQALKNIEDLLGFVI